MGKRRFVNRFSQPICGPMAVWGTWHDCDGDASEIANRVHPDASFWKTVVFIRSGDATLMVEFEDERAGVQLAGSGGLIFEDRETGRER